MKWAKNAEVDSTIGTVQLGYHFCVEEQLMRMKSWLKVAVGAALSLVTTSAMAQAPAAALQVGDQAPAFSAPGSDGKTHTLAESRGKRAVVLAWFPKAFTGG